MNRIFEWIPIASVMAGTMAGAAGFEPVTLTLQNGLNGYAGTVERRLGPGAGAEIDGGTVTSATASYYIDGGADALNDAGYTHGLMRFDELLSQIPAGAKILEAKLTMTTKTHSNAQSGGTFNIYRLTRPFSASSSVNGDFGADGIYGDVDLLLGSFDGMTTGGVVVSADVTRAIQSWVDGDPMYGFGIRADRTTDAWSYHTGGSVTAAARPKLEITYVVDEETTVNEFQEGMGGYTGTVDIVLNANPAVATIDGSTVQEAFIDGINPPTTEPDIPYMVRWDGMEDVLEGRKIESAVLRLVTGFSSSSADSGGPFTVHRLLVPFQRTSVYADFAGDVGAMITAGQITPSLGSIVNAQDTEVMDLDIREAVQAWAKGAPNHGLLISAGTANGWQIFTSGAAEPSFRPMVRVVSRPADPVAVITPTDGQRLTQGTPVTFVAEAFAMEPSVVSRVEFRIDGELAGTAYGEPYTFDYLPEDLGLHVLTATVVDSNEVATTGPEVRFSVVPPAGVGGMYFDGVGDHVSFGDPAALKLSTFTLETWFRRESAGVATTTGSGGVVAIPLVAKGRNQSDGSTLDCNYFLGIRETDGVLVADFEATSAGTNVPVAGRTAVPGGVWQHAAATFDGQEWRLYLNGNLEAVKSADGLVPRADSIQHASLGTAMNSNGLAEGAFGGFMDEVRIWSVARTPEQIREGVNQALTAGDGLVARWAFEEGSGTTLASTVAGGPAGTLSGPPIWSAGQSFNGNVIPRLEWVTPLYGSRLLGSQPVPLRVQASDPDGSIAQVEYFDGGVSIGVATTAPFGLDWFQPTLGTRRITAVATDSQGAEAKLDQEIVLHLTLPTPEIPGYAAGVIDGGDGEVDTGATPADPAPWTRLAGTGGTRTLEEFGELPGDLGVQTSAGPFLVAEGVVMATSFAKNDSRGSLDNLVAAYDAGGVVRVSSRDQAGPGQQDPALSIESGRFALGAFPYADGWVGAWVAADGQLSLGSQSLPEGVTIAKTATGVYQIDGLPLSGNLIASPVGLAADHVTAVTQSGGKWVVQTRDNRQDLEDGDFNFIYIPETSRQVLSGRVQENGTLDALNDELTQVGATVRVTSQGYEITFGDGSVIHPGSAALFLSPDTATGPGGDNVYAYQANGRSFVVFSQDLPGLSGNFQAAGFRFLVTPYEPLPAAEVEVVVHASDAVAREGQAGDTLQFTFSRTGDLSEELVVSYVTEGSATAGDDYEIPAGVIVFPEGSATASLVIQVNADEIEERKESVRVRITPGSSYAVGLYAVAEGAILDGVPVAATTVSFQTGVNGYAGVFEKRIAGDGSQQLGSAVANYFVDGMAPATADVNALMRFDAIIGPAAGQIPAGATVLKAELVLTTSTVADAQSGGPYVVDRLVREFNSATTYQNLSLGTGREGARGASTGAPVSGFGTAAAGQVMTADVTAIVRAWATGEPNHGFAIYSGGTTDGWSYQTVGNSNPLLRPKLVVTYITESTKEYIVSADRSARINSQAGSVTIDGSTLQAEALDQATNNTQEALMRFPIEIPEGETIVKAELMIKTASPLQGFSSDAHSSGPISVHPMLVDWTVGSTFDVFGPKVGEQIDTAAAVILGMGQGASTWVDVTEVVRGWRAGAPNHGFNLKPGTTDAWQFYWPGAASAEDAPKLRIRTTGGTASGYELWAELQGIGGDAPSSDRDGDGLSALLEYALGTNPTQPSSLPQPVIDGQTYRLSFPKGAMAAGDSKLIYQIEESTNLVNWQVVAPTVENAEAISFERALGAGAPEKRFHRLRVEQQP